MKKLALSLPLIAVAAMSQAFDSNSFEAFDNATVQPGGPRTGTSGKAFFNVEGSGNGSFASYGVADFDGSTVDFGGNTVDFITGIKLSFTQSNAGFTMPGTVRFFVTANNADIQPGTSSLVYNPSFGENGVGTQLDPMFELGTGVFNQTGSGNNGTVDTYSFNSLSAGASAMLTQAYLNDSLIRIVVAPDSASVAATWAGFSNDTFDGPVVQLTGEAVPEPATMAVLGLGVAAMLRRRRK